MPFPDVLRDRPMTPLRARRVPPTTAEPVKMKRGGRRQDTSNIFREIGNTLSDLGESAILAVRENLVRRFTQTRQGQQIVEQVKAQELSRLLPIIILIGVAVLVAGAFLGRAFR